MKADRIESDADFSMHHVITRKVVKIMVAENNERYLRGKEVLARVEQNPNGSILDSLASF